MEGELGALEPLKEERRDDDTSMGGGNIEGVLVTDAGVGGAPSFEVDGCSSRSPRRSEMADSASLVMLSLRILRGRLVLRP